VLIQVNVSGEATKAASLSKQLRARARIAALPRLRLRG